MWDAVTARLLPRPTGERCDGLVSSPDAGPHPGELAPPRCGPGGRVCLSYDRPAALLDQVTTDEHAGGWNLHDLRHSALTHLGEGGASLPRLMAKSQHRKIETVRTYVRPGIASLDELTALLGPR